MKNIVIGVEGLVGAGKTSICRQLVKEIPNTILLNGGNLYRAIVYMMMKNGADIESLKNSTNNIDIKQIMDMLKVKIKIENNETQIYVEDKKISEQDLQSKESSMAVSIVGGNANNTELFKFARELIDNLKQNYNVIVAGRGNMKIYPNLDYNFFITADIEERIKRKSIQYNNEIDIDELRKDIIKRDDLQEKAGFYKMYENTIVVDVTECKNVEESTNKIKNYIFAKQN